MSASGEDGNGWPGSSEARTGPKPVAYNTSVSPACAELEAVTCWKLLAWTTARPLWIEITAGRSSGMSWKTQLPLPPPLVRLLAGSSVMEAERVGTPPAIAPRSSDRRPVKRSCPHRPPTNPTPPDTQEDGGEPGGAGPPPISATIMVPI